MKNFKEEPSIINKTDEEVFQAYMDDLRLTPEDFGKKILDVGAGAAQFAKWAKEYGLSNKIYSLDSNKKYLAEGKGVVARAEMMPFADKSFDLVVADGSIPNVFTSEGNINTMKEKVMNSLREMVRVVAPGGEIRLARVLTKKDSELRKALSNNFEEVLEDLKTDDNLQVERVRTPSDDTYEYDENHKPVKLLAEAYLIIIRKLK